MDRPRNRERDRTMTIDMITAEQEQKQQQQSQQKNKTTTTTTTNIYHHRHAPVHRGHKELIRGALAFIKQDAGNATRTRVLYGVRSNSFYVPNMLANMLERGLIQVIHTKREHSISDRHTFIITPIGNRALQLLDELASMIPDAPWLLENTE